VFLPLTYIENGGSNKCRNKSFYLANVVMYHAPNRFKVFFVLERVCEGWGGFVGFLFYSQGAHQVPIKFSKGFLRCSQ
jgi:hypothetical protein